jgi:hypothetical protein
MLNGKTYRLLESLVTIRSLTLWTRFLLAVGITITIVLRDWARTNLTLLPLSCSGEFVIFRFEQNDKLKKYNDSGSQMSSLEDDWTLIDCEMFKSVK